MKKNIWAYIVPVALCFLVGFVASYFQSESVDEWYPELVKSPLSPPNWAFPVAWSFLYVCMGISIGLIIDSHSVAKPYFTRLFLIQLFFNFMWSILFFYLQNPLLGLIDIVILDMLIILYAIKAYPCYRWSSYLFIPYILWVSFATYLNLYILVNNQTPI